jgi:MYXO-CTERM domain-containing protein
MDTVRRARPKRVALLALLLAPSAHANGAFPAVSQFVADPSDPTHLVLRSNFGLLTTSDRGAAWDLVCEGGVGYQNVEPPIAVLDDGTTIAALSTGIAFSAAAGCDFALGTGVTSYVADVSRVPGSPSQAVSVSVDIDRNESTLLRSVDSGRSWQTLGNPLTDLNAATLDVATGVTGTLYVSGASDAGGVLARTSDAGSHWARYEVPGTSQVSAPYIAAVADVDTVYVRLSGTPGHLLITHDGGRHFDTVLDFQGSVDGFALSPDGKLALASGRADGVWRAPTATLAFERLSCAKLRCLSWSAAGLFACADEFEAGFLVGESADNGLSFEPRLHMPCVRGPLDCPSSSSVGAACPSAWPAISEQLGTDCANAGAFMPSTVCNDEAAGGPAGRGGGESGGATGSAGLGTTNSQLGVRPHGGCAVGSEAGSRNAWLWGLASLFALFRRRAASARELAERRC